MTFTLSLNKMIQKSMVLICFGLTLIFFNCSKDDDESSVTSDDSEQPINQSCQLDGTISNELVGNWSGEIIFSSDSQIYTHSAETKSDGSFSGAGNQLQDVTGCWRRKDGTFLMRGTYKQGVRTYTAEMSATIHTLDSISGSHSSNSGESGTFWMTRTSN